MKIPTYEELMLPILRILSEQGELHRREYSRKVGENLKLNQEDIKKKLPSGRETYLSNWSGWAGWYMQQAGLCEKPRRGYLKITKAGRELLEKSPIKIDNKVLSNYPSFEKRVLQSKGRKATRNKSKKSPATSSHDRTPDDLIEEAYQELDANLATDLLDLIKKIDPFRFEQIVIDLLSAMGYGGSREETAKVTQQSNDEGIDGMINEDRLGLDVIYVQAKRWKGNVGRKEIQSFVGALAGKQANKGVFITTSEFGESARKYALSVSQKVILIDGTRLSEFMIEHNVGVSKVRTIDIKRIDSDYFED